MIFQVLVCALLSVSCEKESVQGTYIAEDAVYFTYASGTKVLTVFNSGDQAIDVVSLSDDWFSAVGGQGCISIAVEENSGDMRTGSLSFVCGADEFEVEVCQFGEESDFSSLPEEITVECMASRLAIGYVNTVREISSSCDVDWITVTVDEENVIFAGFLTNETGQERTGNITISDGVSEANVHVVQKKEGEPEVTYSYICAPEGLEYTLSIDVEYVSNASDYRMLVLNPSGFSRSDDELYERLVSGGNESYVFSNDNESPDGYITFYGFEIDQEFQVCIVAVSPSGEFGELVRQTHVIKDTEAGDGTEEYRSWIGEWKVTGPDGLHGWDITIDRAVIDQVLYMQGWDGVFGNFKVPVYFDSETGGLIFESAFVSYATSGGRPCDVYFMAFYDMTTADDMKIATEVGNVIASAAWSRDASTSILPEAIDVEGASVTPESMGYVMQFYSGYETVSQFWEMPEFPLSLVRTGDISDVIQETGPLNANEEDNEFVTPKNI